MVSLSAFYALEITVGTLFFIVLMLVFKILSLENELGKSDKYMEAAYGEIVKMREKKPTWATVVVPRAEPKTVVSGFKGKTYETRGEEIDLRFALKLIIDHLGLKWHDGKGGNPTRLKPEKEGKC